MCLPDHPVTHPKRQRSQAKTQGFPQKFPQLWKMVSTRTPRGHRPATVAHPIGPGNRRPTRRTISGELRLEMGPVGCDDSYKPRRGWTLGLRVSRALQHGSISVALTVSRALRYHCGLRDVCKGLAVAADRLGDRGHEEDIPAKSSPPQAHSRLSQADEYEVRAAGVETPPSQGAQTSFCLRRII